MPWIYIVIYPISRKHILSRTILFKEICAITTLLFLFLKHARWIYRVGKNPSLQTNHQCSVHRNDGAWQIFDLCAYNKPFQRYNAIHGFFIFKHLLCHQVGYKCLGYRTSSTQLVIFIIERLVLDNPIEIPSIMQLLLLNVINRSNFLIFDI